MYVTYSLRITCRVYMMTVLLLVMSWWLRLWWCYRSMVMMCI